MNAVTPTYRLSFSRMEPNLQLAWDSTSLRALKTCPRYYQYNILEGHASRFENAHLKWGSTYNNALVTYNQRRAAGDDYQTAMLAAVRYALVYTWDEVLGRPWVSDEPTKSRETLIRSVIWYLIQFEEDPCQTSVLANGESAVELPFRVDIDLTSGLTGENYILCGYLDRKVEFNGQDWITDWKSTKSALDQKYFANYSPDPQVSQYSFAAGIIGHKNIKGVIIDAVQVGVTFSRFQRAQIPRTEPQLEEWFRDSVHFIRMNETYVRDNYWPQNDTSCSRYGGCPYREVCGSSPDVRPRLLEGLFYRRVWDPLVVREI